jgi:2-amino-4-hydroxy-6-hydroxymethyldihydropteridine diphosphokinase
MSRDLAQGLRHGVPSRDATPADVVVALGANLGDRGETIAGAVADLARLPLTEVTAVADTIESVALTADGPDTSAPPYLNSVVLLSTRLAPTVLLDYLHAIEERHGRPRRTADGPRWQDRTLDLDLIAYGDVQSESPTLTVPHPRAAEREFVLGPWLSVDPDAVLPGRGEVSVLLRSLRETGAR